MTLKKLTGATGVDWGADRELCKTFCLGLIAGLIITFAFIYIIL
tara:strand:- start:105 stop:236 length:132 start_codon:yes stop_codon:yes gene_type:complete